MNYTEKYSDYKWIKISRYKMDDSLTWEERYNQLDKHHIQETQFLIDEIRKLAKLLDKEKD